MKLKLILFFLLLSVFASSASAENLITKHQGLSSSLVNSIFQSRDGSVWIATENGLNRFNGRKMYTYFRSPADTLSLCDNHVNAVFQDSYGTFYVGTFSGLQVFDFATEKFHAVTLAGESMVLHPNVSSFTQCRDGRVVVGTHGHGCFIITRTESGQLSAKQEYVTTISPYVNSVLEDASANLWVCTENDGIARVSPDGTIKKYMQGGASVQITCISQNSNNGIYIGTFSDGVYRYNQLADSMERVSNTADVGVPVMALCPTDNAEILVGTDGHGIKSIDTKNGLFADKNFSKLHFGLTKSKIHSIIKDKNGNLWFGLFQKGVLMIPSRPNSFNYIGYKSASRNFIGSNCVMSVDMDADGRLWVGTDNDGLYCVDLDGDTRHYVNSHTDAHSVPSTIMAIHIDKRQNIWLGSYLNGAARLDPRSGKCQYIELKDNKGTVETRVFDIAEDADGNIWFATMGSGVFVMDAATGEIEQKPIMESGLDFSIDANRLFNRWVCSLLPTDDNKIYIGTYDGLGCYDIEAESYTNTFSVNRLLEGNVVFSLARDARGNIYAGTSHGLYVIAPDNAIRHLTTDDGLPGNIVCSMQVTNDTTIWIGTNNGLAQFDTHSNAFGGYTLADGLQDAEFMQRAVCTDATGTLYFGGLEGITYFKPENIAIRTTAPEVYISDFFVFDKNIHKGEMSGKYQIVDTTVSCATVFNLAHDDNSIGIEFTSMEFATPEHVTYLYSINGDAWTHLSEGSGRVNFTQLDPGTYTLQYKAEAFRQTSETKHVTIVVHPAWYESTLAQICYMVAFVLIILLVGWQRQSARQALLDEKNRQKMNEEKLRIFINIAHEVRTPLTLIVSPLQQLMARDSDAPRQQSYHVMKRNADKLMQLIDQLMDISKLDKQQMQLKFQQTNVVKIINNIVDNFDFQSKFKNIQLVYQPEVEELDAYIDRQHFDKILVNLLNNAFKYTPENGHVRVDLNLTGDGRYRVVVTDDGPGIDEAHIGHIFERFYQIRDENYAGFGTGIGLNLARSITELHHGTIEVENNADGKGCHFVVTLPLGHKHLKSSEILPADAEVEPQNRPAAIAEEPAAEPETEAADTDATAAATVRHVNKTAKRHTIVLVEDDKEIRQYICAELGDQFRITEAANGREAFDIILKNKPDLVISDVMMPIMDGLTLSRKIRQNININTTPIILLTAKNTEQDNIDGLEQGIDAYLTKPFGIEVLRKTCETIIRNRESLRNSFSGRQDQDDKIKDIAVKSPDEKLLERLMKVINENIASPDLSVEFLSQTVGISRVHLHRKMKELTNQTTRDFIRNVRLRQAAKLMSQKKMNVAEVAAQTGFTNPTYFATAFKEMYGQTPTEYMDSHLGG